MLFHIGGGLSHGSVGDGTRRGGPELRLGRWGDGHSSQVTYSHYEG